MATVCTEYSGQPYVQGALVGVPSTATHFTWTWDSGPCQTYHDIISFDSSFVYIAPHQIVQTLVPPGSVGAVNGPVGVIGGAAYVADIWVGTCNGTFCGTYHFYDASNTEVFGAPVPGPVTIQLDAINAAIASLAADMADCCAKIDTILASVRHTYG